MCHKNLTIQNLTCDRIDNDIGHFTSNMLLTCFNCNVSRKKESIYLGAFKKKDQNFSYLYKENLICVGSEEQKESFYKIRDKGICGGLSYVFNRYTKCNEDILQRTIYKNGEDGTFASGGYCLSPKEDALIVRACYGLDVNALYLGSYSSDYGMPVGEGKLVKQSKELTTKMILEKIMSGEYYGLVEFSAHVLETAEAYSYWCLVAPFAITKEINGQKKLSLYMECTDMLVHTELFKFYINHGIILDEIKSIIIYKKGHPLKDFSQMICNKRRGDNPLAGQLYKDVGNGGFGKMCQRNDKYSK